MKILWFSWKDITHPIAGGAEDVTHNLLSDLVKDGHEVVLLTSGYTGSEVSSLINGYRVCRVGGRWSVYFRAWRLFKKKFSDWPDLVIDECNTIPFFTRFYVRQKRVMVFYQLCREIWLYQIFWPLSWIGFFMEPVYLFFLRNEKVITISESSKCDLIKYGFRRDNIEIMRLGIPICRINDVNDVKKYSRLTLLSLGALRPMKRTLDIVQAFEISKCNLPELRLILAGDTAGDYGRAVLDYIARSEYSADIECLGRVSKDKKIELMQRSHLMAVTSVKEGWGLIVTEANSQGTPAVGYDVDGLRDSIHDNVTGMLAHENSPAGLAKIIVEVLSNVESLRLISRASWSMSADNTYENAYNDFVEYIDVNSVELKSC
jgi:glycosyltransferase involved in cell wall biosynthesis